MLPVAKRSTKSKQPPPRPSKSQMAVSRALMRRLCRIDIILAGSLGLKSLPMIDRQPTLRREATNIKARLARVPNACSKKVQWQSTWHSNSFKSMTKMKTRLHHRRLIYSPLTPSLSKVKEEETIIMKGFRRKAQVNILLMVTAMKIEALIHQLFKTATACN